MWQEHQLNRRLRKRGSGVGKEERGGGKDTGQGGGGRGGIKNKGWCQQTKQKVKQPGPSEGVIIDWGRNERWNAEPKNSAMLICVTIRLGRRHRHRLVRVRRGSECAGRMNNALERWKNNAKRWLGCSRRYVVSRVSLAKWEKREGRGYERRNRAKKRSTG